MRGLILSAQLIAKIFQMKDIYISQLDIFKGKIE